MRLPYVTAALGLALVSGCAAPGPSASRGGVSADQTQLVYFGTHGQTAGQGIFGGRFDERTGTLTSLGEVAQVFRPTWLAADPKRSILYAVSEAGNDGKIDGKVLSFAIDPVRGGLTRLSEQGSGGGGPTHLDFDAASGSLFVANFGSGVASVLPVDGSGRIGPVAGRGQDDGSGPTRRQAGPHAHGVTLDPSGRFLLVPDLGADRTFVYRFERGARTLTPAARPFAQVPPGTGPRHIVFGANGRFAYLTTELTAQVIVYRWTASSGGLDPVQRLDLMPAGFTGQRSAAEIAVSSDGRYLYVSSREGENAIYVYAVDQAKGTLTQVQRFETGARPWSFSLSPGGRWMLVAEEGDSHVAVLSRAVREGTLSATGKGMAAFQPVNVTFVR